MKIKQKGYAMLLAMITSLIVLTLFAIVLSMASANFNQTMSMKKNNALKVVAETGIQREEIILRNYILYNPICLVDPSKYSLNDLTFSTLDGVTCQVKIDTNAGLYKDVTTGRDLPCIKITSTATLNRNSKTAESIIDRNNISNFYFDRLFNGSITCMGDTHTSSPVNFDLTAKNLISNGSIYLQGNSVKFTPNGFTMKEGDITFKGNSLTTNIVNASQDINNRIMLFKDDSTPLAPPSVLTGWQNVSLLSYENLKIRHPAAGDTNPAALDDLNNGAVQKDVNYADIQVIPDIEVTTDSAIRVNPTLITYKATMSSGFINFNKVVYNSSTTPDGITTEYGIYPYIVQYITNNYEHSKRYISSDPLYLQEVQEALDYAYKNYGTIRKLILIDGNLEFSDDASVNYNNYVIYCTGTVKFDGSATLYNSSIFAKQFDFENGDNKTVTINGVGTQDGSGHMIEGTPLGVFTNYEKAEISVYLINNLESYADYMKFNNLKFTVK